MVLELTGPLKCSRGCCVDPAHRSCMRTNLFNEERAGRSGTWTRVDTTPGACHTALSASCDASEAISSNPMCKHHWSSAAVPCTFIRGQPSLCSVSRILPRLQHILVKSTCLC